MTRLHFIVSAGNPSDFKNLLSPRRLPAAEREEEANWGGDVTERLHSFRPATHVHMQAGTASNEFKMIGSDARRSRS